MENLLCFLSQKRETQYSWLALILELEFQIFQLHLEVFSFLSIFGNHVEEDGVTKKSIEQIKPLSCI